MTSPHPTASSEKRAARAARWLTAPVGTGPIGSIQSGARSARPNEAAVDATRRGSHPAQPAAKRWRSQPLSKGVQKTLSSFISATSHRPSTFRYRSA